MKEIVLLLTIAAMWLQQWITNQFTLGNLITLLTILVAIVAAYVRLIDKVQLMADKVKELDDCVDDHVKDLARHIEPVRDARTYSELMDRLKSIEHKIDALQAGAGKQK